VLKILLGTTLALSVLSCGDEDCADNEELVNGTCILVCSDGEVLVDDSCVAPACEPATPSGYGDVCTDGTTHTDCTGDADYCSIRPGAAEGTCTATGCVADPCVCPAESTSCMDLSTFDPALPSVCM
jgi:hypothetical protein